MLYKDPEIRRKLMLEHYENPIHKIKSKKSINASYIKGHYSSPSCIDNFDIYICIKNDKINDIKFHGVGCVVATSSTDILCGLVDKKTIRETKKIINNYINMIDNKKFIKKYIDELEIFDNVNKQANRIKCAKVGANAIIDCLNKK
jgi:nitrogen fixation NifU-like protein